MITKPTILVLGAGASAPYGFPLGSGLMRDIYHMLERDKEKELLRDLGFSVADMKTLHDAIPECGKNSINAFLEHRKELMDIGKVCIAVALIPYEIHGKLFDINNDTSWYKYFFNKLNAEFRDFARNKVSIITYNYDRSLEHYLFIALKSSYNKSDEECAEAFKAIPIIHLHGELGNLPWQKQGYVRPYDTKVDAEIIRMSSKHIKIIHESVEGDKDFERANALLEQAKRIYFIGFGYDPINLKRLRLNPGSLCQGTVLHMSQQEILSVVSSMNELYNISMQTLVYGDYSSLLMNCSAYEFVREIDLS